MPQTTTTLSQACARVDIAVDSACATWFDISGSANSVTGTSQTKAVAEEFTFDGTGPIVHEGKVQAMDIVVRIFFTNTATEAYRRVRAVFQAGACDGRICLRWIPRGNVGDLGMQTGFVPVSEFTWGDIDSSNAGPTMGQFTVRAGAIDPFVFVS
jgi:hypothetical protein